MSVSMEIGALNNNNVGRCYDCGGDLLLLLDNGTGKNEDERLTLIGAVGGCVVEER